MLKRFIPVALLSLAIACHNGDKNNDDAGKTPTSSVPPPASMNYSILNVYPHDTTAFTEGLEFFNGDLYESTGEYGESDLRKVDLKTGKPVKKVPLDKTYFGEGITVFNNKIYQLTYREKVVLQYDLNLNLLKKFPMPYEGEGWGMTHDDKNLIIGDGSSTLYFVDPETVKTVKKLSVQDNYGLQNNVNELEYVNGFIYANIWQTDNIIKIDPATGNIVAKADLADLLKRNGKSVDNPDFVLNGIAYDAAAKKFYITGKGWPLLFDVTFN